MQRSEVFYREVTKIKIYIFGDESFKTEEKVVGGDILLTLQERVLYTRRPRR